MGGLLLLCVAAMGGGTADGQLRDGGPMRGDAAAPVTLIEYSDFTCGYCVKFFRETWPRLHSKYVATGKLRFVYRDYPRANSGAGLDAAVAARCAGEQGQYWPMHDFLFDRAGRVSAGEVRQQAKTLGLRADVFQSCMSNARHAEHAFADRAEGSSLGFRGTPGFVLMLTKRPEREPALLIPGAVSYDVFEEQIERLLAARLK
ncbi:MAG TPA: thioredoxin domain-containing protein [Nitrospirales bacterium]|nr:thioredoxin domain-containing protein [Nitrospirales bacterium]